MRNILTGFLLIIAFNVSAQTDSSYESLHQYDTVHYKFSGLYLKSYWSDTKSLLASPAHWRGKDFAWAGAFVVTDLFLYSQDKTINDFVQRNRSVVSNNMAIVLKPLGNGVYVFGADAALYGYALLSKNKKLQHETLEVGKTCLITLASVLLVKEVARRQRPYVADNPNFWGGPFNNDAYMSFYSGHTTLAFTWATNVSLDSKKTIWKVLAYTVASGVALSRMNDNDHWASDVFTGAVVSAYLTNKIFKAGNW